MSQLTKTQRGLLAFNIVLVVGFGAYYLRSLNYEFVAYALTIALVISVLYGTLKYTRFPTHVIIGITVWGVLHMLGGSVQTADGVLYAWRMVPIFDGGGEFFVLKYDQAVHAYAYGVVGLMFLHLLRNVVKIRTHRWLIASTAIFAAAGFSIINEIVEFWAAVNIPDNGVGGYYNTVLDLIFNLAGAAITVLVVEIRRR